MYEDITKYSPEWDDCVDAGRKTGGDSPISIYERAKASLI